MQNACWLVTLFAVSKPRSPGKFQRIQPAHSRDAGNAGSQTNRLRPWLRTVIASPQAKGQRLRLQGLADRRKSHHRMPGEREPCGKAAVRGSPGTCAWKRASCAVGGRAPPGPQDPAAGWATRCRCRCRGARTACTPPRTPAPHNHPSTALVMGRSGAAGSFNRSHIRTHSNRSHKEATHSNAQPLQAPSQID